MFVLIQSICLSIPITTVAQFFCFLLRNIEKLIVWHISVKINHYDLTKNSHQFQASVTKTCPFLSKRSGMFQQNLLKKLSLKKILYYSWTSSQVIFKVSMMFVIFLSIHMFTSYITYIFCICILISKSFYFSLLLFLIWKSKERKVLVFGLYLISYKKTDRQHYE